MNTKKYNEAKAVEQAIRLLLNRNDFTANAQKVEVKEMTLTDAQKAQAWHEYETQYLKTQQ